MLNSIILSMLLDRKKKEAGGKEALRCQITPEPPVSKEFLSLATAHSPSTPTPSSALQLPVDPCLGWR